MIKDRLKIILITYNRCDALKDTLEQIMAEDSPIKDFDITILNNVSTDGTDDLIYEYQKRFPNLKHIKNPINIGGNANICRAFEMLATSGSEYGWVLCDDDVYNLSNWKYVEEAIEKKKDIICVSNYSFPSKKCLNKKENQIFQLAFVPACIFRTENITDKVIHSMYEAIFSMFQQLVPVISAINDGKEVYVLTHPIVFNGMHFENKRSNRSFTRGSTNYTVTDRKKKGCWILGFSNAISILKDKKLIPKCMNVSIPYTDIYGSWRNFYFNIRKNYFNAKDFNYFLEVYKYLPLRRKLEFIIYNIASIVPPLVGIPAWFNTLKVITVINRHNHKCNENK